MESPRQEHGAVDEDMRMKFNIGDLVVVTPNEVRGAERIPKYIQGRVGRIAYCYGRVSNPLDHRGIYSPLYSVEFNSHDLFQNNSKDKITADVHEDSLRAAHTSSKIRKKR